MSTDDDTIYAGCDCHRNAVLAADPDPIGPCGWCEGWRGDGSCSCPERAS